MRPARAVRALAAAFAIMVVAAMPAGSATPSTVSGLTASVSGDSIVLTGAASFGGQDPVVVGDDAVGDNLGGAPTSPHGTDLDRLLISQPDPATPTLQFTFDLAGLTAGGVPEHLAYNWDIRVDGGEPQGGADRSLKTWRTRVASTQSTDPYAAVFTCVPQAPPQTGSSCSAGPDVPVTYDETASEIRMSVPLAVIDATPGSTIDAWLRISSPVYIGATFGTQTLAGQYDQATHDQYVVPTRSVRVGIAPVGSPVSYSSGASLSGSSFTGSLAAPGPGTYTVGAQACFGDNCGTETTTITIG
jgi:hypothetical protein